MDYFNTYDVNKSIDEMNGKIKEMRNTGNALVYSIPLFLISVGVLLYFYVLEELWFLSIFAGVSLFLFILGQLIKNVSIRHLTMNKLLNSEAINQYNSEHETNVTYTYNPKNSKTFNENMGLFTRYSSASIKYQIKLDSKTKLIFTTIQTNSGNSNQIHFSGIYLIFDEEGYTNFQVRTNGKPHQKGKKFIKEEREDIKLFKLENEDRIRFNYNAVLSKLEEYKKKYIASNGAEVHIAFSKFKTTYKHKNVDYENFREYYHQIESLLNLVFQIKDVVNQ